ncbi:hypothetical protein E2C01_053601 [Portunus trituberculatus]|uniref:Uncharacterized protein n=1 Tax=Portunus trituberculatus TaxID=210409 RepID=A0A5B7GQR6_PORTR|nr:hypothetical protein [Portunus trituberculatus]
MVAKPWLMRLSGGVFPVWDVVSLEGEEPDGAGGGLVPSHAHFQLCQYSVVVRAAYKSQLMTLKPVLLVV